MPQKKYIVRLTAQEREICRETIRKLNGSSEKVRRAQMLVKADADGPAWTDQQIADAFSCRTKTSRTFANDVCWKGSSRRWSENGGSVAEREELTETGLGSTARCRGAGGIVKPTACACAHRRQGASLRSAPAPRG